MNVDILAIGVHPDDVELACAGTVLKHISLGHSVAILDLTQGELGTRGTPELRLQEAQVAAKILGVESRRNLGMEDGFFELTRENKLAIAREIRLHRPKIILANAIEDRHPDHGRAAKLVNDSIFISGLKQVALYDDQGKDLERWRPQQTYHYIQDRHIAPDLVVDISGFLEDKMKAIRAFSSQFHDPTSNDLNSPISTPDFLEFIRARAKTYGRSIGVEYGEGFTAARMVGVADLGLLL